ncbi:unnamed protein product, partial [Choristocarpus tenellus]
MAHRGARRWIRDSEVSRCFLCFEQFSVTTRKHHCSRFCGRIACSNCSSGKALIPLNDMVHPPTDLSISTVLLSDFDPREPQRVCQECEIILQPMQEDLQV